MKRLYALLVILIILYIGINVGANNLNLTGSDAPVADDSGNVTLGETNFSLDNFTENKTNETAISLFDSNYNMTILVEKLDNGQKIGDIASGAYSSGNYTSNQTIDQNGVTTYFLYNEGPESYGADIYFNKNNQNYKISGDGIDYANSDYFINNCKGIIDSLNSGNDSNGLSRW
ncbi:hypothetical protein [uncultured Methanobrevibacter sp.]|uniref:hypothetical protein n=1 Tax=uncultured Methanobrevibacter sp. TaxID=253161 RepID=UPI002611D2A2|nr:hypothetical protein [uncultured Methanobrevibacter sp.]